jgi:NADH:ubiquinone oxidoreductase subunit 6 (subunit J)
VDKTYESSIAASMIVMTLSIIAVVIIYITVGHVGPTYSSNIMSLQQRKLRQKYGLPAQPIITNLKILQIPSSIRSIPPSVYNGSSN